MTTQRCGSCGGTLEESDPRTLCPECGGLLELVHPTRMETASELRALFHSRTGLPSVMCSGVWRYRELVMPSAAARIVSYPEGNTPLISSRRISEWAGSPPLVLKHEGMNPTGSFKDRGMAVALTQALRVGATAVACASTGNTSSSLAAYAAIAGIPALVLVPDGGVSAGKLAQTLAYGARTLVVRGDFDDCMRLAREASDALGVYLVNSVNPFRIEGQKTIIFEMLQQLEWSAPDWIALPAGNLGNASAFGKALREAHELGLIDRLPRLALVQAAGAAPFAASFRDGFATRHRVKAETVATAIRIGDPVSYERAVAALQLTDGVVTTATDEEILEAKAMIDASGVGCEPASAASVAGVRRLVREKVIDPRASVVAVLTGHLLKDSAASESSRGEKRPRWVNAAESIEPTLQALERILRGPDSA